jgi:hypothetical protein
MLVLRRRDGDWVEIVHKSGDVLRVRVYDLVRVAGCAHLAFDDAPRNFTVLRPERARRAPAVLPQGPPPSEAPCS